MEITTQQKMKTAGIRHNLFKVVAVFAVLAVYLVAVTAVKFLFLSKLGDLNGLSWGLMVVGFLSLLGALFIYFLYSRKWLILNIKELAAVCACIALSYTVCIYTAALSIYLMPVALAAFLIAPIAKRRDAFVGSLFSNLLTATTILVEIVSGSGLELFRILSMLIVGIFTGALVSYSVSNDTKRLNYLLKGLVISVIGILGLFLFSILGDGLSAFWPLSLFMVLAGVVQVLLGLSVQPVLESIFNLVTNARLVELTDRSAPLIKRLMEDAPGTFSHSLAVANFAEVCAAAIGENPYLARACAYYHDVGKLVEPEFFKENQTTETNPHDELLPEVSAEIIRSHTSEGLKLCNEYRIPEEVSHVTVQHHGTLLIPVFYNKAKKLTDGDVSAYDYSYHGVTPVTKIAAIIMICDSGEAAIRAMEKPGGEGVDSLLKSLINSRIAAGQFDNCDISLKDLDTIRETMVNAFGGLYHKRMKYPEGK